MTEKQEKNRSNEGESRFAKMNQTIDRLVGAVSSQVSWDKKYLSNALIAYMVAVSANHPYADNILEDVVAKYASRAKISLSSDVDTSSVNHAQAVDSLNKLLYS